MPMLAGAPSSLPDMEIAIIQLLRTDPTFSHLSGGPYNPAPEYAPFPYVTFGEHIETPWNTYGNAGWIVLFIMHLWSVQASFSEVYAIHKAINAVFVNRKLIGMTDYYNVALLPEETTKLNDPDTVTRHLVARYRAWNIHV